MHRTHRLCGLVVTVTHSTFAQTCLLSYAKWLSTHCGRFSRYKMTSNYILDNSTLNWLDSHWINQSIGVDDLRMVTSLLMCKNCEWHQAQIVRCQHSEMNESSHNQWIDQVSNEYLIIISTSIVSTWNVFQRQLIVNLVDLICLCSINIKKKKKKIKNCSISIQFPIMACQMISQSLYWIIHFT